MIAFLLLVITMSAIVCGHWTEPVPPPIRRVVRFLTRRRRHRP
ncbi:hypothetical protein [Streptomyces murinus]